MKLWKTMIGHENLLFVYGTLLNQMDITQAQILHAHATLLGEGYIHGLLYTNGHYPGATLSPLNDNKVFGQVMEIHSNLKKVLSILDEYEEVGTKFPVPNEYTRQITPVFFEGKIRNCWAYIYNHPIDRMQLIESGRYQNTIAPKD